MAKAGTEGGNHSLDSTGMETGRKPKGINPLPLSKTNTSQKIYLCCSLDWSCSAAQNKQRNVRAQVSNGTEVQWCK